MKKVILFLVLSLIALFSNAEVTSLWNQVDLQVKIIDPTDTKSHIGRTPIMIPNLSIDGYNLLFETPFDGCILQLVNEEGDVEYSIVIPADTTSLTLPSYLSGEYELQIIRGQFCFYGNIEL